MVQMYDHRAAAVVVNEDNIMRAAQQEDINGELKTQSDRYPVPQYWVSKSDVMLSFDGQWVIAYKSVTAPTNMRTMIAAMLPECGVGNSMAMLLPQHECQTDYSRWAPLLLANLCSFSFDFALRQKVQGQNLNWFIVEQAPVIAPTDFDTRIAGGSIADFVREQVLRLTYTAHDLKPYAQAMGYDGEPFQWDEMDRKQRMAALDALFMHLYGIEADDASYILDTFPIVREQDTATYGSYLTKELVLAGMAKIAAGQLPLG